MKLSDATRLKKLLWQGQTPASIAKTFIPKLKPAAIYHIRSGLRWASAPWPDGSLGALPDARIVAIDKARVEALTNVRVK